MDLHARTGRASWFRRVAVLAALTLVVAGCGGDDDDDETGGGGGETTETSAAGEPRSGGEITVGLESESAGWLPSKDSQSQAGLQVMYAIHDALMAYDADGAVQPYLAESLEPNADLTEYTLTLRPGVLFHDGEPLDALAIKTIFDDYLKAPDSRTAGSLTDITAFEVTGELTGVYKLAGPNAAFPDLLTGIIGMPFSPKAASELGPDYSANPVGTGPFRFVSWQRDGELVVEKNPDYWQDGKPYLDRIRFRPLPDEESRVASLLAGEVDVMHTVRQAQAVEEADDVQALIDIGGQSAMTYYNTARPPTDDLRVRQALVHAVDQAELISVQGLEDITFPTYQPVPADSQWATDAAEEAYPEHDPEAAEALLQEYVDDPDRSDGKAPGEPPEISLVVTAGVASLNDLAQLYQESWEAVGFEVTLDLVDQPTLINKAVGSPPDFAGDYVATLFRVGTDNDPDLLRTTFYDAAAPANISNWTSAEASDLFDEARVEPDVGRRAELYGRIWELLATEVPLSYHGGLATAVGAQPDVRGIPDWTLPDGSLAEGHPGSVVHFVEVWLDS